MGPKKPMLSPFGIFMDKMKMTDNRVKSMAIDEQIHYCNEFYQKLSPEVMKQFQDLSSLAKKRGLNQWEINKRLTQIDVELATNRSGSLSSNGSDDVWDDPPVASTSQPISVEFNFLKRPEDEPTIEEEMDNEELDYSVVMNAVNSVSDLPKSTIVVICFNVMVKTEREYVPIEIGITKFSVKDGLQDSYTKMIAAKIPEGYYAKAKDFCDTYHKIPINTDHEMFERDSVQLFHEVYDHLSASGLKDDNGRYIVFCKAADKSGLSDLFQVKGCLLALEKAFRVQNGGDSAKSLVRDFVVAELTDMLTLANRACSTTSFPAMLASDHLIRTIFDFYPNMRCDFHAETDNNYCALAVTKRSAYLFLDVIFANGIKPELDIKPKASHRPVEPEDRSVAMKVSSFGGFTPRRSRPDFHYPNNHNPTNFEEPTHPRRNDFPTPKIGIGRSRVKQNIGHRNNRF